MIVRITITDGLAFTSATHNRMLKWLRKSFPEHEVMGVKASEGINLYKDPDFQKIRESLSAQIAALDLRPGDQVTHLDIATHGATDEENKTTLLKYIGGYGADGPGLRMKELLAPLKPYISPELVLVQNSCETLCGTEDEAIDRSRALLQYLGAPNGQIYGAITLEANGIDFPSIGLPASLAASAFILSQFMAADGGVSSFNDVLTWMQNNTLATWTTVGVMNALGLFRPIIIGAGSIDKRHNIGRLIRFRNGKLDEFAVVHKNSNWKPIYSRISCLRYLR